MKTTNYTWKTQFDTANDLMIHTFSDRVKVSTNIKTGEVKVFKDGEKIKTYPDMTMKKYDNLLLEIAAEAAIMA